MKVLICGDRNWSDKKAIRSWIAKLQDFGYNIVVEGEARGADSIARDEALVAGMTVERYPAQWQIYGRGAGPIRNKQMLEEGRPDLVLFFHYNLSQSKGTAHMVRIAMLANIPVIDGYISSNIGG